MNILCEDELETFLCCSILLSVSSFYRVLMLLYCCYIADKTSRSMLSVRVMLVRSSVSVTMLSSYVADEILSLLSVWGMLVLPSVRYINL